MPSRASPRSPSAHLVNNIHVPADLTFLFTIKDLSPNYAVQEVQSAGQFWLPPNIHNAYQSEAEKLYRWVGGRITRITNEEGANREIFDAATVFSQMPVTPHLLAVNIDAEREDVSDHPPGWRTLSFDHVPVNGDPRRTYASIVDLGEEAQIAGPGSPRIIGSLLPSVYDYVQTIDENNWPIPPEKDHAGLIGSLPVLLALAAFSAPPGLVDQAFDRSVRPGTWVPHSFQGGHISERGMVVTVYLDLSRPKQSTRLLLNHLQNGGYGPFYGP